MQAELYNFMKRIIEYQNWKSSGLGSEKFLDYTRMATGARCIQSLNIPDHWKSIDKLLLSTYGVRGFNFAILSCNQAHSSLYKKSFCKSYVYMSLAR